MAGLRTLGFLQKEASMAPGSAPDRPGPSCCCLGSKHWAGSGEAKSMDPGLSALQQPLNLTEDPCRNAEARDDTRAKSGPQSWASFWTRREEWRGRAKSSALSPSQRHLTLAEHWLFGLHVLIVTVPISLMRTPRLSKDQWGSKVTQQGTCRNKLQTRGFQRLPAWLYWQECPQWLILTDSGAKQTPCRATGMFSHVISSKPLALGATSHYTEEETGAQSGCLVSDSKPWVSIAPRKD